MELRKPADFAAAYIAAGFRVIPCRGKVPLTKHGAKDASADPQIIAEWWTCWPTANVGLTLDGLVAIDIDPRNGGDIASLPHALPETCYAQTGGGGWHYLYRAHNGTRYPGKLGTGIDLKSGAGSYIVVEPSVHPDTGNRYCWLDESEPWSTQPAPAPEWLAQAPRPTESENNREGLIEKGRRNSTLTSMAGAMRRHGATPTAILAALRAENAERCTPPLEDARVERIAKSVARYPPASSQSTTPGRHTNDEVEDEFATMRSASSIMRTEIQPLRYCVPSRVPAGLVIIAGRPKSRKSWYALQLCVTKAMGGQFMGVQTDPGRVLYIALEDNDRRMRERLEFFGITSATAPANLHIEYEWPTGLEGAEKLERWLTKFPDTRLIVVDVLQRFRGPRDGKMSLYEADYQTMAMLHGIAQRHADTTILVVHHTKKAPVDDAIEAISGTFGIVGAADAYIILRRSSDDQWTAHVDGRDWGSWEHDFEWEFRQGEGWVQLGAAGIHLTDAQAEIVRIAREGGGTTPQTIASVRNISRPTAHEALQGLVTKGAMVNRGGRYYAVTNE